MNAFRLGLPLVLCSLLGVLGGSFAAAQQPAAPRSFAVGVLQVIEPTFDTADSHTLRMVLPDLEVEPYTPHSFAESQTLHAATRNVVLFRDLWQYEFAFLGLRQVELATPQADGQVLKKNVWYLVYRVRNTGKTVSYDRVSDELVKTDQHQIVYDREQVDPVTLQGRFFPLFELVAWVQDPSTGEYRRVQYLDSILPSLVPQIQAEEDPAIELLDSVAVSRVQLPLSRSEEEGAVWGVAVWQDVDPNIDFVSVRVRGLTNAYRIDRNADGSKSFRHRELQLNFYRPGDTHREVDDRVAPGVPFVDSPEEQAVIARRYELPGPMFKVYEQLNQTERELRLQADSQVDLESFVSPLAAALDGGKLPAELAAALSEGGAELPADTAADTLVPGAKWRVEHDGRIFEIELEPQFWERSGDGIRLIRRLEHAWIYR